MIVDTESFIAGVQLGRRLKVWEARDNVSPEPTIWPILTESEFSILTENGEVLIQQIIPPPIAG